MKTVEAAFQHLADSRLVEDTFTCEREGWEERGGRERGEGWEGERRGVGGREEKDGREREERGGRDERGGRERGEGWEGEGRRVGGRERRGEGGWEGERRRGSWEEGDTFTHDREGGGYRGNLG